MTSKHIEYLSDEQKKLYLLTLENMGKNSKVLSKSKSIFIKNPDVDNESMWKFNGICNHSYWGLQFLFESPLDGKYPSDMGIIEDGELMVIFPHKLTKEQMKLIIYDCFLE